MESKPVNLEDQITVIKNISQPYTCKIVETHEHPSVRTSAPHADLPGW